MMDALDMACGGVALEDAAEQRLAVTAKFFHGLSDLTRLRIVELLLEGEKNVSELVTILDQPQSRVSNHLACLRWCGYVDSRRDATDRDDRGAFEVVADRSYLRQRG